MNAVMKVDTEIDGRTARMDPRLKATDHLADRWARSQRESGSLHPIEAIRLLQDGAVLGGAATVMADDVLAFDQVFAKAPYHEKAVIRVWYLGGGSAAQKAKRLHISRTTLYLEWKVALQYMKGELRLRHIDV